MSTCQHPIESVTALVVMNGTVTLKVVYRCTLCGRDDLQLKGLEVVPMGMPPGYEDLRANIEPIGEGEFKVKLA